MESELAEKRMCKYSSMPVHVGCGFHGDGWADRLCVVYKAELQRVSHHLRQSTKQLCRNLKDNPNVAENMAKVSAIRQSLSSLLLQCLSEVEVDGNVKAMVETVMAQERHEVLSPTRYMLTSITWNSEADSRGNRSMVIDCVSVHSQHHQSFYWFRWK